MNATMGAVRYQPRRVNALRDECARRDGWSVRDVSDWGVLVVCYHDGALAHLIAIDADDARLYDPAALLDALAARLDPHRRDTIQCSYTARTIQVTEC